MSGSNPNIPQGSLNRIRASAIFQDIPFLSVTSPFLGKGGISLSFRGDSTVQIDTMTGIVTSPEPFLGVTMTMHLLKTQSFAQLWRTQLELLSLLGSSTVRPDSIMMQPWNFSNCSILGIGDQVFDGSSPDFPVRIGGIYQVNSTLFAG